MLPEIARSSPSRRNPFYRSANFNGLLEDVSTMRTAPTGIAAVNEFPKCFVLTLINRPKKHERSSGNMSARNASQRKTWLWHQALRWLEHGNLGFARRYAVLIPVQLPAGQIEGLFPNKHSFQHGDRRLRRIDIGHNRSGGPRLQRVPSNGCFQDVTAARDCFQDFRAIRPQSTTNFADIGRASHRQLLLLARRFLAALLS
jgi:hypothetical protein